ncbi:MAG: hypothetical protein HC815_33155 [Richelia sp. RM1_1_1]|nr:hypothetical protein [Richelia sp. RM1_1_1]
MTDIAGNTFETALDIEVLNDTPQIFEDEIGNDDNEDYYLFRIEENSTVNLKLSELSENASLYLYDSDGNRELIRSTNSNNVDEVITRNLKAGSYYIRVANYSIGTGTSYKLEASATSLGPIPEDIAGDNLDKAFDLGTLNTDGITVNEFIGDFNGLVNDFSDYYRFDLAQNSTVSLKLSGLSTNADLYLYNSDGSRELISSTNTDNVDETINLNLKAGSYYFRVSGGYTQGTTYQLEASATSLGAIPVDIAGENFDKAYDLGTLGSDGVTVNDFIGDFNQLVDDYVDYYKFDLAENSTVNLKLSELSANATLYLHNSDASRLLELSNNADNASEEIIRNLKAGSYYIIVIDSSSAASTTYKLEASATSLGAIPEDIAGENRDKAYYLGTLNSDGITVNDFIGDFNGLVDDIYDYYKFDLAENSTVNLKLSKLSANATLFLYNSDGSRILESSNNLDNDDEVITRNLKAGSYYINVIDSSSGAGTNYKLEASATSLGATPVDIAGENIDKAYDLGALNSDGVTVNDFIGDFNGLVDDNNDYYKFELTENSTVNLKLSELSANAALYLYDSDGSRTLESSNNSENDDEIITRNLKAGNYYIRVIDSSSGAGTTYKLEASANPTQIDDSNQFDTATDIGTLSATALTINDSVGNNNSSDYYKFELAENSTVNLKLSELSANATLYLYNSDGSRELIRSSNSDNANEIITRNLQVGTYHIRVADASNNGTTYKLEASATSLGATPVDSAGENFDQAKDLGTLGSDKLTINEFIGSFNGLVYDSDDYYKFELADNSTVNLKLSELSKNATLYLYNSDGSTELIRSSNSDNADEIITRNLQAGSYHIRVTNISSIEGTTYKLEASATSLGAIPVDSAGENFDKARNLGTLGSDGLTINEYIGDFNGLVDDNYDYYRFDLAENSTVNLKLSELSGEASLYLYNSDGSRILESSNNEDNANEIIIRNLKAGSYYIGVQDYYSSVGTTYKLEASATSLGATPVDSAGENFDKARDLGTLSSDGLTINEFIGDFNGLVDDNYDYYRFDLAENSTVNLKLSELSANASLQLYNSDGSRELSYSANEDNADELITRNLKAGSYYISVRDYYTGAGTTYKLEASATSLGATPVDSAGENFDKARNLGTLNSEGLTINEFIGNFNGLVDDNYDYYRFDLAENSTVSLKLSELSANASLQLYNSDGSRVVEGSNNGDNADEVITRNLKADSYYVIVQGYYTGAATTYKLEASATPLDTYQDNGGDTLETARDIGTLDGSQNFSDFIGNFFGIRQDNADFYRFQLKESSSINLSLSGLSPNTGASLQLLGSQGNLIRSSTNNTLNTSLFAGTYYFRVSPSSANGTNYNLTATGIPIPDLAGNSISQARNISILSGTQTFTDFVGDIDRDDFYRFELLKDSSVNLGVSPEIFGTNVSLNLLNSRGSNIDSSSTGISRDLDAGIYYAQVRGNNTNYDVSFSAIANDSSDFQIKSVTPVEGSNVGQTTITVKGSQFTSNAQVSIIDTDGTEVLADKVNVQNDSTLTATFNLVGLTAGAYDVKVVDDAGTATAEDLFQVSTGNPGKLDVFISAPGAVRPWSTGTVVVTYRNSGDTDITAPLLTLTADGAIFEENGEYSDGSVQFLGINQEGDAGVLPPGATGTFSVRFRPKDNSVTNIDFQVNSLATDETVDWDAIKDSSRPDSIPVEAWEVIFNNFTQEVGKKAGEYEKVLAENASRLSELGEYTGDVSQLLAFELQQVNSQGIFERFNLGSFGRGWNNPWEITANTDDEGNVTIQNGGSLRFFTKQEDGSYKGEDGDNGILTKSGDTYRLRESGGTVVAFNNDGKLDFIQDTNNNQVTAGYTDGKLTTLTYTNGDVITFAYNSGGRISEVTDQFGQKTTYTYDATGEKLLSVSDESGTITYTYETDGAKENAIKSITFPDGTQTLFEYDDQGRLIKESFNGGVEEVTYSYDSAGGVTVTDADGNVSQLSQNALGQVSRIEDALGRVTEFRYDDTGNLTRIIAPGDNLSSFNYDSRGNLLSSTDPLGQRVEFTYDTEFDQIETVRDQRGNSIDYNYDDKGNLSGITYADGSSETYSYNDKGEVTISVNRRDEAIDYTYDSRGLLTKKEFADGTEANFEYDSRGNLTTATDADSSVTYAYDSADRLTKVSYGTGRFLEFTYDAGGRRTLMVDQDGFTTNYSYDDVGRLKQLTDKDGANIITYSYNNVGQLAREDNGNGTYTTYDYDAAGQLLNIVNYQADDTVNSRFDYTYDELGRRTSMTTLEGTTSYGYDVTGQLTSVTLTDGREIAYRYDAAGNRISVTDDDATTAYNTNNLNQYTSVGNGTYTYDTDGNLISKTEGGQTWTYSYDTENRLIGAVTPEGTWSYEYDALGNRIASIQDGQRTDYLLDPTGLGDVVGEYSSGNVARYTHGLGLVSRVDGSNAASYYDADAIGSVVGLTGASGDYVNSYSYLPFGEDLSKSESVANPFEFVGEWGVMDEGNRLDFMRARFYMPGDGRFISDDPIGLFGGDSNIRRYVKNDPLNAIDPSGLGEWKKGRLGTPLGHLPFVENGSYDYDPLVYDVKPAHISDTELNHEHFFFDKEVTIEGKVDGKEGTHRVNNIGFGPDGLFTYDKNGKDYKKSHFEPSKESPGKYDDDILLDAIKRKRLKPYTGIPTPWTDNCQSWADGVRKEYHKIKREKEQERASTAVRNSSDPNDIIGPSGYGDQNWLTRDQILPYTIRFENQASATAAAVFVTITQQLDSDLDLSTFELGDFGFGDIYIDVPDGFQSYNTRVDLRDTIGDFVDFDASLNTDTGEVTWKLTTIDPDTGEIPDDVDAGFLPPNNDDHDGEGFVNYKVKANSSSTTGTVIDAEARIIFDTNDPIDTPAIFNTIDIGEPSSNVETLPATVGQNFNVSWTGSDDGSGIVSYDVYVSVDGGKFELWLDDTSETSAVYTGEVGKTYSFYSVAKDGVGYTEEVAVTADTTAKVNDAPTLNQEISNQTVTEDSAFNFIIPANTFNDVDAGDELTYSVTLDSGSELPSWLSFDASTRSFSGTPSNGDVGTLDIKVVATDSFGETVSDTFTLEVENTNDVPTLESAIANQTVTEDSAFNFIIPANTFNDVDAGDELTYSVTLEDGSELPSWLSFDASTRSFSGTPSNGDVGTVSIKVVATDSFGETVSDSFTLEVENTNDVPTLESAIANQKATEDSAFNFTIPDNTFNDVDALDELTYSVTLEDDSELPDWLTFNPETRTFSGTPTNDNVGNLNIKVVATDKQGTTASDTFTLEVENTNDVPTLESAIATKLQLKIALSTLLSQKTHLTMWMLSTS